jgi:hypothetical protein
MEIKYQHQKLRQKRNHDIWVRMATDYNGGMTVEEIRERYKKLDGKKYTRTWIYMIFKKLINE